MERRCVGSERRNIYDAPRAFLGDLSPAGGGDASGHHVRSRRAELLPRRLLITCVFRKKKLGRVSATRQRTVSPGPLRQVYPRVSSMSEVNMGATASSAVTSATRGHFAAHSRSRDVRVAAVANVVRGARHPRFRDEEVRSATTGSRQLAPSMTPPYDRTKHKKSSTSVSSGRREVHMRDANNKSSRRGLRPAKSATAALSARTMEKEHAFLSRDARQTEVPQQTGSFEPCKQRMV